MKMNENILQSESVGAIYDGFEIKLKTPRSHYFDFPSAISTFPLML